MLVVGIEQNVIAPRPLIYSSRANFTYLIGLFAALTT